MTRKIVNILFSMILIWSLTSCSEEAITIRVPEDQPTIQHAILIADNDDIVLISPGIYYENIILEGKRITIASKFYTTGEEKYIKETIIDGEGSTVIDIDPECDETAIIGLTIQNGSDGILPRSEIQILNNHFIGNKDGIDYENRGGGLCKENQFINNQDDGIDLDEAVEVTIESNIVKDNGDDGIEIRFHPYRGPMRYINIRKNTISDNGEDGIQLIDYDGLSAREVRIERNLIINNAMVGVGFMADGDTRENYNGANILERIYLIHNTFVGNNYGLTGGANVIALNNIFYDTQNVAIKHMINGSIVAYCLFWNNAVHYENTVVDSKSLVFQNPFLDSDYSLMEYSPAIDSGMAFYEWKDEVVLDEDEISYAGIAPDIGAYEYSL